MSDEFIKSAQVYAKIANDILNNIENGNTGEARMPWNGISQVPTNPISGRRFSGSNIVALWTATQRAGYKSPYWASERAWKSRGGYLQPMAAGVEIFMPVFNENEKTPYNRKMGPLGSDPLDPTGNRILGFKKWKVYNQEVVDGAQVAQPSLPHPFTPIQAIEDIVMNYLKNKGPALHIQQGSIACYNSKYDRIVMPSREAFGAYGNLDGNQYFYSVLLHEGIHSTGSKNRLDRYLSGAFGSHAYAREELVAELGAAFVSSRIGLSTELRKDHANYIKSWLDFLKNEQQIFFKAVGQASKAADFLLDRAGWTPEGAPKLKT